MLLGPVAKFVWYNQKEGRPLSGFFGLVAQGSLTAVGLLCSTYEQAQTNVCAVF